MTWPCWKNALGLTALVLFSAATVSAAPSISCGQSAGRTAQHTACCKWFDILDDVQRSVFSNGECDLEAREALRLMFHDAISYSTSNDGPYKGGGADGSILEHADIELQYAENEGLDDIGYEQRALALKHNVPFGDFLHFTGAVGLSNCEGAPRLQFFAGRSNSSRPAPDGFIPAPFQSVDTILARVKDAGFEPGEMVTLLASHSLATQHTIDPTIDGTPLDSTPDVFDAQFFLETSLKGVAYPGNGSNRGEAMSPSSAQFRLQSDSEFARDPRTRCAWQSYIINHERMSSDFVKAMHKVSTLGQDTSKLVDCSDVIPVPKPIDRSRTYARFPPGKTYADVDASCPLQTLPTPQL